MKKILLLLCAVLLLAVVAGIYGLVLPENDLKKADALLQSGNYEEAAEICREVMNRPLNFRAEAARQSLGKVYYQQAEALLKNEEYQAADNAFKSAGDYGDAAQRVGEPFYVKAEALMSSGDYKGASAAFAKAGAYSDAADRILEPYFHQGEALLAQNRYSDAAAAFESAGAWKNAPQAMQYSLGLAAAADGDYLTAVEAFRQAGTYADAADQYAAALPAAEAQQNRNEAVQPFRVPGTILSFGSYEQDGNTENGAEPLNWMVLEATDNACKLITVDAIDCQTVARDLVILGWEESPLRGWLNGRFKSTAFTETEREALTPVPNQTESRFKQYNPYADDLVTLLDVGELSTAFATLSPACTLTVAAMEAGAVADADGLARWWLCDKGTESDQAPVISGENHVSKLMNVNETGIAVRPVVWVLLDRLAEMSGSL